MKIYIKYSNNGGDEVIDNIVSWSIKDNCLQIISSDIRIGKEIDGLGSTVYIPLYNVLEFIPGGSSTNSSRYIQ